MSVRSTAFVLLAIALSMPFDAMAQSAPRPAPNLIIIFLDDLGYGDFGCYGHPTIATPNIDRMAAEGQRWTNFYSAAPVCTSSRAALLTGRMPARSGMCSNRVAVLSQASKGGLPADEITLAEALKPQGYATACIGKWHLGHRPEFLPTTQGFDSFFGLPYSNDMDARPVDVPGMSSASFHPQIEWWNVPLIRGTEVIERPADQTTLTGRYTQEAIQLIRDNKDEPFFIYLAHNMPHVPLFRTTEFADRSLRGLYGDVVEELDWSVGQILETLRAENLADSTYVFLTSDNGPWLFFKQLGGSAGLLRDGKGTFWEGGIREPFIAWAPGRIEPGVVRDMAVTTDLFVTCLKLAGAAIPDDRALDSFDLGPALRGTGHSPRTSVAYFCEDTVYAVRKGPYKAHFTLTPNPAGPEPESNDLPLLYHLDHDPSERFNLADDHPEIVAELRALADRERESVEPVENQLERR